MESPHSNSTAPPNGSGGGKGHDSEEDRCFLLGPTALIVQAVMGVMVISSLVVKRQLEKRKRRWRVWVLDVGKQLAGQAVIHGLNLLISQLVAHAGKQNPCSLYFLNILIDTTIGTAIIWISLKWYTAFFVSRYGPDAYTTGHYGNPPQWRIWAQQLQPYLLAAVTMKLVVLLPLTLPGISDLLIKFAHGMLSVMSIDVQVVFVLAIFPTIMNIFQFCVVDQLIKARKGNEQKDEHEHDSDYDMDDEELGVRMYRPVATDETFLSSGITGPGGYPQRRRGSSVLGGSSPPSRSSTVANSAPPSPLLPAAEPHSPRKIGSLRLSGVGEDSWDKGSREAFGFSQVSSPVSESETTSRNRRSDAPSPDAGVTLFAAPDDDDLPLTNLRSPVPK